MEIDIKVSDIINCMEKLAPTKYAYSWDNVGLQLGNENQNVQKILTTLDVTNDVIKEAIELKADMIIAHHPLIFGSIKKITSGNPLSDKLIKLIQNNIAVYIAHTNLDVAKGGTNDLIAEILKLENVNILNNKEFDNPEVGIGRTGDLKTSIQFGEFIKIVKEKLSLDLVVYTGDLDKQISKIGICTGSGSKYMMDAKKSACDLYITGDVTYHVAQEAVENDLCLLDATHFATEIKVKEKLALYINEEINNKFHMKNMNKKIAFVSSKSESFMKYL